MAAVFHGLLMTRLFDGISLANLLLFSLATPMQVRLLQSS